MQPVKLESSAWWISILVIVLLVFLIVLSARRRRSVPVGRLFQARCANPRHAVFRSSDEAELRSVRPVLLTAVRGTTSKRKKICVDCIYKLSLKPEFRDYFKVISSEMEK